MANIANWVAENCSTIGTGNLTLTGSVDLKDAVTFSASLPAGEVWYSVQDGANREAGIGTFDGNNTIVRTTVHATKTGNTYNNINPTPLSLSGQSIVGCTFNTQAFDEFLTGINNKLPLDGSLPMTGSLTISRDHPLLRLTNTSNGHSAYWNTYETGSNYRLVLSGGDLNGGNGLDVFNINFNTGIGTFSQGLRNNATPTFTTDVPNKSYTDSIAGNIPPPASAASPGTAGNIAFDTNYFYVCTATNTWQRAAIGTW